MPFRARRRFPGEETVRGGPTGREQAGDARLRRLAERLCPPVAWEWLPGADHLTWSPGVWDIFGLAPRAGGPRVVEVLAAIAPQDRPRFQAALTRVGRSGDDLRLQVRVQRPDGAWVLVQLLAEAERDLDGTIVSVFGSACDLTDADERGLGAEPSAGERRLIDAIDALPDGFVLYDAADRLVMCNNRYRALYPHAAAVMRPGLTFEDVLRRGLAHGHYPEAVGREAEWLAQRLEQHNRPLHIAEQAMPGDRWIRVIECRTPSGDHVGLRIDVTDQRRQARELERERARAEAANRAKSSFLANMSHEIRTPMNGVIGMAQALAPLLEPGRARDMLAVIEESGEMLMSILNDILDFSKIEAGRMTVEQTRFSLADMAHRVEVNHMLKAVDRGTKLTVMLEPNVPVERLGDPVRVQQILHNLVSNAVKFTEGGEIAVTISNGPGNRVVFQVRDTGIGMSPDQAAQMFSEYTQADTSITRKFGGTGLGLSIVKGLTQAMGGEVTLKSALGYGTTFRVILPLPVLARAEVLPQAVAHDPVPPGLRILAAEDNRVNRLVLMSCLDALQAKVTMVETGPDCLAAFDLGPFDVALIDISMPGMDGAEVIAARRRIEADRGLARTPAIAVTAHAMTHQIATFLAAGFDSHLAKPIRRHELEARLRQTNAARSG